MPDDIDRAVDKIQEILIKQKGHLFVEYLKTANTKTTIKPIDIDEEEKRENDALRIKTMTVIDDIIGGGIPEGKSALIYGEFGSGKTQTFFTMVALCKGWIIYIDTEDSFSLSRLKEICDARQIDYQDVKKRLILYKPKNWLEQMLILQSIPSPSDIDGKLDLIICDSLVKFFRGVEFSGRQTLPLKMGFLREFILGLEATAKMHRAGLIYSSQVTEKPAATAYTSKADIQSPIGGHSVEHQPDFVLFYRKGSGNIRVVRMIDSSYNALAERPFIITARGIEDLPDDAKQAKNYEDSAKKFDEKQKQESMVGKPKDKEEEKETERETEDQ